MDPMFSHGDLPQASVSRSLKRLEGAYKFVAVRLVSFVHFYEFVLIFLELCIFHAGHFHLFGDAGVRIDYGV